MKEQQPTPLILDMWAYGCAAPVIAAALQIEGGWRKINKIIEQARSVNDPRAVLHTNGNTRKIRKMLERNPAQRIVKTKDRALDILMDYVEEQAAIIAKLESENV